MNSTDNIWKHMHMWIYTHAIKIYVKKSWILRRVVYGRAWKDETEGKGRNVWLDYNLKNKLKWSALLMFVYKQVVLNSGKRLEIKVVNTNK